MTVLCKCMFCTNLPSLCSFTAALHSLLSYNALQVHIQGVPSGHDVLVVCYLDEGLQQEWKWCQKALLVTMS